MKPHVIEKKPKYLWLGRFIGFGTGTFPKTFMPPFLAEAHLQTIIFR
jgi:hypothetical protein